MVQRELKSPKASELINNFLNEVEKAKCVTEDDFQSIGRGTSLRLIEGITFLIKESLAEAEHKAVSYFVKLLGPIIGHQKEIADALWRVAAKGVKDGTISNKSDLIRLSYDAINDNVFITCRYIKPARNVVLDESLEELSIGPVRIIKGTALSSKFSESERRIEFGFGEKAGFEGGNGKLAYNVTPTMWDIKLTASSAARYEQAIWLTCIATTLIRFVANYEDLGVFMPRLGDTEASPFKNESDEQDRLVIKSDGGWSLSGPAVPRVYVLGTNTAGKFALPDTIDKIDMIYNSAKGSLAERLSQGVGWLAKGRQAEDRAERFLFFFTALESLLSLSDKTAPVVQTVARHAAVILTNNIEDRVRASSHIKKLYETRSKLIHAGNRNITFEEVKQIQEAVETTLFLVWKYIDLSVKHIDFCDSLSRSSFGLPYIGDEA